MPIYEYICPKCGEKFERRRNIDDKDSDLKCPGCGKEHPRRIFCTFSTKASSPSPSSVCAPETPT
jgi:putative FmdB family regulatory protein